MSALSTSTAALLRPGLLAGRAVLLVGSAPSDTAPSDTARSDADPSDRPPAAPGLPGEASGGSPPAGGFAAAVDHACTALGASVSRFAGEAGLDDLVAAAVREMGVVDVLAVDGAGLFAAALAVAGDGHAALRACMDGAWDATRAVVTQAFLAAPAAGEPGVGGSVQGSEVRGGRVVYLAPAAEAGEYAEAARAGLENLARTLSIEWARHGITTVAIAPRAATPTEQVATLVAYLASPGGAYFSGCLLDLRGVASA